MNITIIGIYKHDFMDYPEELRMLQTGDPILLQKEPDNHYDPLAVRAYAEGRFIGYVAVEKLPNLHRLMGPDDSLACTFVSLSEEAKRITASTGEDFAEEPAAPSTLLDGWHPTGPCLSLTDEENDYRCTIGLMETMVKQGAWEMATERTLSRLLNGIPYMFSGNDYCRLVNLIRRMRNMSGEQAPAWLEAAEILSRELGRQGRPEQHRMRYQWVRRIAESDHMTRIMRQSEEALRRIIDDLPEGYEGFYQLPPDIQIGRLVYAHLPDSKLRPLLTRLCIQINETRQSRYADEDTERASVYVPEPERSGSGRSEGFGQSCGTRQGRYGKEEPFGCYFSARADAKDRKEMIDMLRTICRRDKSGNNAAQVCRQLKQWEKEGLLKNVFYCRKELYKILLHYGFGWTEGSLYNAITRVMSE